MDVERFAAGALRRTVKVRGNELVVRALSDAELGRCARAFVRPRAPMIRDSTRGSLAEPVADVQDQSYRDGASEWNADTTAAQAVLAAGLTHGGKSGGDDAWLREAVKSLRAVLSRDEIVGLVRLADELAGGGLEEAAKKD